MRSTLRLPRNEKNEIYEISNLYPEQQTIVYMILHKIHEWLTCDDFSTFVPLRCTIIGQAGSGKSVLINTITAAIRVLFEYNEVICIGCPTGTAAFNANGETLHNATKLGIREEYKPFSMSDAKRRQLCEKFKHLLCLIIDERSLLSSKVLGSTAQVLSETIFEGGTADQVLGALPVLVLVGDDYQLPSFSEGGLDVLFRICGSKMTQKGRQIFKDCAKTVFKLSTIRRISDARQNDKDLLQRVRLGNKVTDDDVARLQSLHIDNIRDKHGPEVVQRIEDEAIYLFWTNEKRMKHNLQRLGATNTPENPTAIVKPIGYGDKLGKSIRRHFDSDGPKTALICIDAKVCIQGQNFYPLWGLHNGACGTVKEIVFAPNENPNKGHQPQYVVVNFPQYIGPPWDIENPKVRFYVTFLQYLDIVQQNLTSSIQLYLRISQYLLY
jgi:PIF1-like helicase